MQYERVLWRGQLDGEFSGFDEDAVFKLADGTFWLQAEYYYWYFYAYRAAVEIFSDGGMPRLRVAGQSISVPVRQLHGVIESRIAGEFHGWEGDSEYELTNGQVWRQARYKYSYKYKYRPEVTIYDASGGKVMDVDGCRAVVRRIR